MLKYFFTCLVGCVICMGSYAFEASDRGKKKTNVVSKTGKKPVKKKVSSTVKKTAKKSTAKKSVRSTRTVKRSSKKSTELTLDAFSKNKGKFIWPVEDSRIKTGFGLFKIAESNVVGSNPGLTLEAAQGSPVMSIYEGVVKDLFQIEGKWGVTVQHGNYFSVYSNLASINIAKDDKIALGDVIGTAANNSEGNAEVEFLLMKNNKNIDPEPWIMKK
jgi:murein hydrolase activator